MGTVTFDYIRRIQIEEQKSSQLTKIPEDFYESVSNYLEKKRENISEKRSNIEIKNVERLVKNIYERRERKILNAALLKVRIGVEPQNLINKEREFFEKIVNVLREMREEIFKKVFEPKEKEQVSLVVFKEDFPAFVGTDGLSYGPFKKGDVAKLPEENVKVLLERGVAEEFKVEK